ncbi:MAG: murein biosynthesis integral membrane protein MurJ [Coriobacteriia bacterium]|nr:murein biosynthesis integral membrane protein MurJ [Coriobacteriia bacterium]
MSMATLLSRITGFVRIWATAMALGVGVIASGYNIANNVPNMIFELVAGGILSSLFIPTYMDVKRERGEEGAWKFASHIFNIFIIMLGVVALIGTLFPGPFIWTQTFRDSASSVQVRQTASFLFRFFAIQVVLYGGGMVIQAVLNANRKFLWPALGPVFNNLVVIATMFYVATQPLNRHTLIVMAVGTTLGVAAMFIVMLPSLSKTKLRYSFKLGLRDPAIKKMMILAVPGLFYVITNLITVSFRNASAQAVSGSGASVMSYAWTWYQLPYGILAVALATALFTELSEHASAHDTVKFKETLSSGLRQTALLIMPAAGLLYALATPLVTLYTTGRFKADSVPLVAGVLRTWALALTFYACMMFVLRCFYSLKDTKTPAMANILTSFIQIGGYMILTTGIGTWRGFGLKGIPFSDLIFCLLQFSLLLYLLRKKIGAFDITTFISVFVRMGIATVIATASVMVFVSYASPYFADSGGALSLSGSVLIIIIGAVLGLTISFGLATLFQVKDVVKAKQLLVSLFHKILGKRKSS